MKSEYNIEALEPAVLILALDTTSRSGSIAIVRDGSIVVEYSGDPARAHAERLPTDLITACRDAGVGIEQVELFAVAAGPGSFTGMRIGIAAVQGLAMARDRRVVAVSTLEALAVAAARHVSGRVRVAAWIDAHRGEVYAQVFDHDHQQATSLVDAIAAAPQTVIESHQSFLDDVEFHGDGAIRYRDQIRHARGGDTRIADQTPLLAGAVGLIASRNPARATLPHAVVPLYVRSSDVERNHKW